MSAPTLSDSNPKLKIVKTEVRPTGEAVQLVRPLAEGTKSTDQIVGELVSKFDYKTQSVKAGEAELNAVQKAFGANLAEELIKTYDGSNLVSDLQQDLIGEKYLAEQIKRIHEQQKTTSILDKWSHLLYEGEKDESSPSQFAVHNYVAGTYRSSGSHHSLINPQPQSQQSYQVSTQSQSSSHQPVQSEAQFQASSRLSRAQSGSVISSGSQKSLHASQREALEQARQAALAQQEQALRAQALAQEQARIQQALEEEEKQSRIRYYAQVEAQAKSLQEREARQQAEAQAQARAQQQYEEQQRQQQQQQQQHHQAFYFHQESRQQQKQQQQASPSYDNSSNSFQQPQPYLPQLSSSNLNSITLDAYNSPEFKAMLEQLTKPLNVPPEQVNYPPEWPSQDKINLLAEPIYIPAPQPIVIPAPNILFLQNDSQDNASQQQVSENILERLRPTVSYYPQVQKNDEAHMQNYGLRQIHVEGSSSRSGF